MLGPVQEGALGAFMRSPQQAGRREITTVHAGVAEVVGLHDRVAARGAEIVMPLEAQDHGGSSFSVRDPEGHVFTFGDCYPFA